MLARFGFGGQLGRIRNWGFAARQAGWSSMSTQAISKAEDLLERTKSLDDKIRRHGLIGKRVQAEHHALMTEWRAVLFQIPHHQTEILHQSAQSIDKLLHANLDQLSTKRNPKASKKIEKSKIILPPAKLLDDLETGIYAWGRSATEYSNSPLKAESLFKKYKESCDSADTAIAVPQPTAGLYSALVYCWSQAPKHKLASEKSLSWFRKITESRNAAMNSEAWNALLRIHVRQGKFSTIAKNLLNRYSFLNNGYSYVSLVEGLMNSDSAQDRKKAFEELQRGIVYCMDHEDDDKSALRQVIYQYLVESIKQDNVRDYEHVMNQAIVLQEKHPKLGVLDVKHFIIVMNALSSKGEAEKVQELFRKLQAGYENGSEWLKPNYQVLVIVLSALAKQKDRRSLESCESMVSMIESYILSNEFSSSSESKSTNHAYNVMLDCYIRNPYVKNKRERVETLIQRMELLSNEHKNPSLLPDKHSYAALLKAIIEEGKPGFDVEIEKVLKIMEDSDRAEMKPDKTIYTIMLDAIFMIGGKAGISRANELLERMRRHANLQPDRIMYTILMKIHSFVGDAHGSEKVLNKLIEAYDNGRTDCHPNEIAFITAIIAWERSGREDVLDQVFRLFNKMVSLHNKGNYNQCKPTVKSFGKLMVILAESDKRTKLQLAQQLLSQMKAYGVEPDSTILNWYIRVCSTIPSRNTDDHNESWNEATLTFQLLQDKGIANSQSYNSMFHAGQRFLRDPEERYAFFRDTYYKCRNDGKVDRNVLTSLRRFLSPKVYQHLTKLDPRDSRIKMKLYRELNKPDQDHRHDASKPK